MGCCRGRVSWTPNSRSIPYLKSLYDWKESSQLVLLPSSQAHEESTLERAALVKTICHKFKFAGYNFDALSHEHVVEITEKLRSKRKVAENELRKLKVRLLALVFPNLRCRTDSFACGSVVGCRERGGE